jgi:3-hydroxybutyryl-CoA dehydratase
MSGKVDFDTINLNDDIPQLSKVVSQERINKWADVVDDYNPLHVDPEYAKKTKFKRTIAHGPLVISYISEMMGSWLGSKWIEGGKLLDIKFKAPVKSEDRITIKGTVGNKIIVDGKEVLECEVFIINQEGEKVLQGRATVPID